MGDECQVNSDCSLCSGGYCNMDCGCTYPTPCQCSSDQDCDQFDGICDVPSPHHPQYCSYCDDTGLCKGGCIDSANCPDGYECNDHICEEVVLCVEDTECQGYNNTCNVHYNNCFYCGGDCGANDGCCPGCHDSDLNCQYPTPICDGNSHICGCWNDNDCNVGDFCNSDTNVCEAQCVEDTECVGFDQICNENYDNCFYCGAGDCETSFGCCPGSHDSDLNCQYPKPICMGDHTCGCQSDSDCNAGDFCNSDTNACEKIPDECQTDADCNEGLTGVCATDDDGQTIECKYCESNGLYNVCKPGCKYDSDSNDIPRCPVGLDDCNVDTHNCQASQGSTLLTKIVFSSKGCNGCTKEGVNMTLAGDSIITPQPRCKTVDLNHPDQVDFAGKSTFTANAADHYMGWENCWQGALEGRIEQSTVTWTGEGTWMPESICYDWSKETNRVFVCTFSAGTSLSSGQSATGSCGPADGTSCP